ncbi:MAG: hypothetical protein A2Z64_04110 [Betaproteobacteria bacterium RIFCSPLOWO2_02_67_12]|nr:MAG: hypothetical protein A2Z64_04110 [Betaproteobacteria bacterium RIFCSPLOWO2_02_67_12]OGA29707.1 MAG: hypothetical protein A3I65_06830 [Betaproteobacteria bacterium RIFCSPLOWO2_02_FULL_68_150]OGA69234.1 MAG: hypothetical protein A3F77_10070 [Betaproteobacteria bacterium RIFCSPLOWO2_12_FULL_67_28]
MLKWLKGFSGGGEKPDHPMYSVRETEKLLADLPETNPGQALDEIVTWIESVSLTPGYRPELRAAVLRVLEDTGLRFEDALLSQYLSGARIHDHRSRDRCQKSFAFRAALSEAYLTCLVDDFGVEGEARTGDEEELMSVLCRGMRSTAMQEKVRHLSYQGVDNQVWGRLYRYYRAAEMAKLENRSAKPYRAEQQPTTPQQELLRPLMLEISALESLAPEHVELASRMVARNAGSFSIASTSSAAHQYCIDLGQAVSPFQYGDAPPAVPTARFFGPGSGIDRLKEMLDREAANPLPGDRKEGQEFSRWDVVRVLKHLVLYWGSDRPFRLNKRTRAQGKIYILHSLDAIRRVVIQVGTDQFAAIEATYAERGHALSLAAEELDVVPEVWPEKDVSENGVGVEVPQKHGDWVKIGRLCAVKRADSDYWWVGVIRRLDARGGSSVAAGIEILSKHPSSMWLKLVGKEGQMASNWATSTGSHRYDYVNAVMLESEGDTQASGSAIAIDPKEYVPDMMCEALLGERTRLIKLGAQRDSGDDFVIVKFGWA